MFIVHVKINILEQTRLVVIKEHLVRSCDVIVLYFWDILIDSVIANSLTTVPLGVLHLSERF